MASNGTPKTWQDRAAKQVRRPNRLVVSGRAEDRPAARYEPVDPLQLPETGNDDSITFDDWLNLALAFGVIGGLAAIAFFWPQLVAGIRSLLP